MNESETTILSEISYKALNYPEKISNNDFINGYNIVFCYCSKPTNVYEIRGYPIYKLIVDTVNTFTVNLRTYTSLEDFNLQFKKIQKSVELYEGIFSYLSRYFIKTNVLKKNEKNIVEINQIFHNFYYKNHFINCKDIFFRLFFFELEVYRSRKEGTIHLKEAFLFFKNILCINGDESLMDKFQVNYLESVKGKINFNESIKKVCMNVYEELVNISAVFDNQMYKKLSNKIVSYLSNRNEEMVEAIIKRIESKKEFSFIYKLLELLGEDSIKIFNHNFENYLKNKVINFEFKEMFDFFVFIISQLETQIKINHESKKILKVYFKNFICRCYLEENHEKIKYFEEEIYKQIYQLIYANSKKDKHIVSFIKLIQNNKNITNKAIEYLQKFLLFNAEPLKHSKYLCELFSNIMPNDEFLRSVQCINDIKKSDTFNFQNLQPKLLSKGFWQLKNQNIILHKNILLIYDEFVKFVNKEYKRAAFTLIPRISPISINFYGNTLNLNTDMASLLFFIEELESINSQDLFLLTKDPFLNENLTILKNNSLIIENNDLFSINKVSLQTEPINLFIAHEDVFYVEEISYIKINKVPFIESLIMRVLKNKKSTSRNELIFFLHMNKVTKDESEEVLNNLIRKMYCKENDGIIYYIP